jgi:hypothetical protein
VTNGHAPDGHHRHENLLGAWVSVRGDDEPKSDSVIMDDLNALVAAMIGLDVIVDEEQNMPLSATGMRAQLPTAPLATGELIYG